MTAEPRVDPLVIVCLCHSKAFAVRVTFTFACIFQFFIEHNSPWIWMYGYVFILCVCLRVMHAF